MNKKEKTVNVTLTLGESQVVWLDDNAEAKDTNRSQIARTVFREKMASEERAKTRKVQA